MINLRDLKIDFKYKSSSINQNWGKLTWLLLFSPFLLYSLRNLYKINPDLIFFNKPIIEDIFINFASSNSNLIFKLIGSLLPVLAITFFEFLKNLSDHNNILKSYSLGKLKDSRGFKFADIWYFVLSYLHKYPKFVFFLTLGTSYFHEGLTNWFNNLYTSIFQTSFSSINTLIIFVFVILLADLLRYIKHRAQHSLPILWDLHEFHHSATQMTIISSARDLAILDVLCAPLILPFEVFSALMINQFLSQGLLIPVYLYVFDKILETAFLFLGHSSFKVIYPKPFSHVLMSPALHWLHHSDNPKHFDKNFGSKYTFWDKLFNSYLDESHLKDLKGYGVNKTQYNKYHPLYSYCVLPYNKLIKRLKSGNIFTEKITKQA